MISIGDKLDGKYVIVCRLGDGGYGEVFLADDEAIPDRRVRLKCWCNIRQAITAT